MTARTVSERSRDYRARKRQALLDAALSPFDRGRCTSCDMRPDALCPVDLYGDRKAPEHPWRLCLGDMATMRLAGRDMYRISKSGGAA